jgi:hypothetical protein
MPRLRHCGQRVVGLRCRRQSRAVERDDELDAAAARVGAGRGGESEQRNEKQAPSQDENRIQSPGLDCFSARMWRNW